MGVECAPAPVAVITGAGRGIGRAIAVRLARDGMKVAVADINPEAVEETARLITATAPEESDSLGVYVDVTDAESIAAMTAEVEAALGSVSVLVNSAGVISVAQVTEIEEDEWDRILSVNLKGPFLTMRAVLPGMIARRWGRVINIASDGAKTAEALLSHYCASKFGLVGLTQSAALECATSGVTVNSICPVIADTPMREQLVVEYSRRPEVGSKKGAAALFRSEIPMGREVRPEEIASVAAFLAGPDSAFITGEAINVSGGHEVH